MNVKLFRAQECLRKVIEESWDMKQNQVVLDMWAIKNTPFSHLMKYIEIPLLVESGFPILWLIKIPSKPGSRIPQKPIAIN